MREMFRSATAFNKPLNDWDVSSVTNMGEMFFQALAFNQILCAWGAKMNAADPQPNVIAMFASSSCDSPDNPQFTSTPNRNLRTKICCDAGFVGSSDGLTCSSPSSGGGGDPHFKTWTHEKYDFHGACDMVMLSYPKFDNNKGMDVHIRTKIRFSRSYIESAILKIGQDTLEIMGGDMRRSWINGVFGSSGKAFLAKLGGYTVDYVKTSRGPSKQRIYTVDLGNGEKVVLKTYKDFVSVDIVAGENGASFAGSVGLMGSYTTGDKLARNGETVLSDPIAFGQEWQVLATETKLFHSLEGPQ